MSREQIYAQRDRIFVKLDLTEDVDEMLQSEVESRVELGLTDDEGPWKLIAWLEGVQPAFESQGALIPSYGLKLLLDEFNSYLQDPAIGAGSNVKAAALKLIGRAVEVEQTHMLRAIDALINKTEEGLDAQIADRKDALDAYFDGLRDSEEPIRPSKAAEELSGLVHFPVRLNGEQSRLLTEDPDEFKKWVVGVMEAQLIDLDVSRVMGAIERRVGEPLGVKIQAADWDDAADQMLAASRDLMKRQMDRLSSQIENEIDGVLQRERADNDTSKLRLLLSLSQGARTLFDQHTHRQVRQLFSRFSYVYFGAHLLENRTAENVSEAVLEHLQGAEEALQTAWGQGEYARLSQNAVRLADFGPAVQVFGEERINDPASALDEADRAKLIQAIGAYVLNEVKRQLLLSAISELWVEYLTKVEALRISIGLEAYAQRDPLVQYKSRASDLFQQLLADVRSAVIGRVFSYQPRRIEITPSEVSAAPAAVSSGVEQTESVKKKRKRH